MIRWQNDPDGYLVSTLNATGAVLAVAESDATGPVQWFSRWIAEGGSSESAAMQTDGAIAFVLQGENAGQGLFVVWAIENGIESNELVLMLLGEGYGSASTGNGTGNGNEIAPPAGWPEATQQQLGTESLSSPTNLVGTISTLGHSTLEFECDWLAQAGDVFINWYGSSENGATYAAGAVDFESIGGNRYQSVSDLPVLPDGYLWSIRLTARTLYYETDYSAPAILQPIVSNQSLQTFTAEYVGTLSNNELIARWTFSDTANPVPVEIESRIDGDEWKTTLIAPITYQSVGLYKRARYQDTEQSGYLGIAHQYRQFDNGLTDHVVELRARIGGGDFVTADQVIMPLFSLHYPQLTISSIPLKNGMLIPAPSTSIYPPVNSARTELEAIFDGDGHYEVGLTIVPNALNYPIPIQQSEWFRLLPTAVKIGATWTVTFRFISFDANGTIVLDVPIVPQPLFIPLRNDVMPSAPTNFNPTFKKIRDPFTNNQTGCEFTARLEYDPNELKAAVSIDSGEFSDITWTGISAFPPQVKFNEIAVPRDGLSHIVMLKIWHHDSAVGEDSDPVIAPGLLATFDMAPPAPPTAVTATLVRDGVNGFPDQVLVEWTSDDPVDIFLIDPDAKKRKVYSADAQESSVVLENARKYGTQDGQLHEYRFGVAAFNRSTYSTTIYAAPVNITSGSPATEPQTPDEIAGTAQNLSQAQFITAIDADLAAVDSAVIAQVLTAIVQKIKFIVSKGGSVTLDNIGQFAADWTAEKTAFRNGQYVVIPAQRNAAFNPSLGLIKGTRAGLVLSDIEAANIA